MNRRGDTLRRFIRARPDRDGDALVVVVAGGKGGTGTSTFAAGLALGAARTGSRTLLVDAAEGVGSLHLLLGAGAGRGLPALRTGVEPADLVVPVVGTLSLLPGASPQDAVDDTLREVERRVLFGRVTELFHAYDVTVIDAGSRLAAIRAACGAAGDRLLAVTDAGRISLAATYALLKAVATDRPELPSAVVINRAAGARARAAAGLLDSAGRRFLTRPFALAGAVPDDPEIAAATERGTPLQELSPTPGGLRAIDAIAAQLLGRTEEEAGAGISILDSVG